MHLIYVGTIILADMKETNTMYARIVLILLAVNLAFTGYAVLRLSESQQEQIDTIGTSVTAAPSTTPRSTEETSPTDDPQSE